LFCPNCKLEYRTGYTRCADCAVDLVAVLPKAAEVQEVGVHDLRSPSILRRGVSVPDAGVIREALKAAGIRFNTRRASAEIVADGTPSYEFWVNSDDRPNAQSVLESALEAADNSEPLDSPQLLWGGNDRGLFDQLCAALDEQGILYLKYEPFESRLGEVAARKPLEISVGKSNYDAALEILASLSDDAAIVRPTPPSNRPQPHSAAEDSVDADPDDLPAEGEEFEDDDLTAEAWSGSAADQAGVLKICLREVGIASRVAKNAASVRLLVAEQDVARSREIVREVIEAAPPE
jgi:hypothetical protein